MGDSRAAWLRRRQFYRDNATMSTMRADDQIARHIMRGLGYRPEAFWKIERALGIDIGYDEPMILHVRLILDAVSNGMFTPSETSPAAIVFDTRESKNPRKWLEDNMEDIASSAVDHSVGCIMSIRNTDTRKPVSFAIVHDLQTVPMWLLQRESMLVDKRFEMQAWCRNTEDLFHDMARYMSWDLPILDDTDQRQDKEAPYVPICID